jgi:uncharacterized membrane protein YhhN
MSIGLFSLLFAVLLGIELYGELTRNTLVIWISKPLLMPVLLILFLNNAQHHLSLERICVIVALVCSCLGDILLMNADHDLFLAGLISFLIGHLSYIVAFLVRIHHEGRRRTVSAMIVSSVPFLLYIALILSIFYPKLMADDGEGKKHLLVPIIAYTFVIVGMAYISFLRDRQSPGFWLVLAGAMFFVCSDSILAVNKFIVPVPTSRLLVMSTYGLGQYLITIGTLKVTARDSGVRFKSS